VAVHSLYNQSNHSLQTLQHSEIQTKIKKWKGQPNSQIDGEEKKTWESKSSSKISWDTLSGDTIKLTISLQILCNANQIQYHQIFTYFTQCEPINGAKDLRDAYLLGNIHGYRITLFKW
jgi:hypothetical protein